MNLEPLIRELRSNRNTFHQLFSQSDPAMIRWKPAPEKWCLLEIACHLLDEEREDFRARARFVFETPQLEMPKINPQVWVTERNYMDQNYEQVCADFDNERDASIEWLSNLQNPPWDNAYIHYKMGPLKPELFLTNWVAHDYLHLRQIIRLKYDYLKAHSNVPLDYAGEW